MASSSDYRFKQDNLRLVLETPFGTDYLLLQRLTVEEAISRPFQISLGMISERMELDPKTILGKSVTVTLQPRTKPAAAFATSPASDGPEDRYFHGIVTSFRAGAGVERNQRRSSVAGLRASLP